VDEDFSEADLVQASELAEHLTGEELITLEPAHERLYFFVGSARLHRSKLMSWWRRGWIEILTETLESVPSATLGRSRRRVWELTHHGQRAVKRAGGQD